MEAFVSKTIGRTFVVKLVQGDDILGGIEELIRREHIENAVLVSGIATVDRCRLHMISTTGYPIQVDIVEKTDVPLELVDISGFICDGQAHIHCTVSDRQQAYAGHMLSGCRTLYLGEIVIQELLGMQIHRHPNEHGAMHIYAKE